MSAAWRAFTQTDWYGLAGAVSWVHVLGIGPLIANCTVDGFEAVAVIDAEGLHIEWYVDDCQYLATLSTADGAARWAILFSGATTIAELREAVGFEIMS